ncbi:hypothetical protein KL909_005088 [Ogataea angusta]|nr:hypothetical protein KL909_005088 [Ogataea angusta]KAG7826885.1 hypothetical protein KL920_005146 [Ogataea angusta]KAG7854147.1 hypothetical protein KL939_005122 [Ogataea angusta]
MSEREDPMLTTFGHPPQMMHFSRADPNAQSSQMRAWRAALTKESHAGHLPSHFSHSRPTAVPGCLRHSTKSS